MAFKSIQINTMKILQINKYFYQKGGSETVFFNTIQLLQDNGHTVIPFSLKDVKNKKSDYDTYFVDYPEFAEVGLFTKIKSIPTFIYNQKAKRQLEKLLQKEKPDIAHIHLLFNSLSVSILPVLRKYNVPVVMTVHDYRLICPAYTFTDGKGDICEKCLQSKQYWRCAANKCSKGSFLNSVLLSMDSYFRKYFISPVDYIDKFIFVSKFAEKKHLLSSAKFEGKSTHLYNFTFIGGEEGVKKEDYILYFGRVSKEKGLKTLIQVIEKNPTIKLKVAGTGPLLDELKKQERGNIEFLGFQSGKKLEAYIQKAMFTIVPSEWYENNPLSVIESQALGTPVIGSNIGGIPELIKDNVNGFLFEPKSAEGLNEVLKKALTLSSEEYDSMCRSSKQFAEENYSNISHYKELLSIYRTLL